MATPFYHQASDSTKKSGIAPRPYGNLLNTKPPSVLHRPSAFLAVRVQSLSLIDDVIYHDTIALRIAGLTPIRWLGAGANGAVFLAKDSVLHRQVALKIWHTPQATQEPHRAIEEMRKLASISHPLLATVHSIGVVSGFPYAVMEYIPGLTARRWLSESTPSIPDICAFWSMYVEALKAIHLQQRFHGDPHLGNVMLCDDNYGLCSPFWRNGMTNHFAVKMVDLGTSAVTRKEALAEREPRIVLQAGLSLWRSRSLQSFLCIPKPTDLRLAISIITTFCEYQYNRWLLADCRPDTYRRRSIANALACEIVAVPLYNTKAMFKDLASITNELFIADVVFHAYCYMRAEIAAREIDADRGPCRIEHVGSRPVRLSDFLDTLAAWKQLYLEKRLYDSSDPPVRGTYDR